MHYFGMCGLPRRVCVYESGYAWINTICSIGSFISAFSGCFFVFILWESLVNKKVVIGYYGSPATLLNLCWAPVPYHNSFFVQGLFVDYSMLAL